MAQSGPAAAIDAVACATKVAKAKTRPGQVLLSAGDMNKGFTSGLACLGRSERRDFFGVTAHDRLVRGDYGLPIDEQKRTIAATGHEPIGSYNQREFVKGRIAVEVQFGEYAFVAHDLLVRHLSFQVSGIIDVGIEIFPVKELEKGMSSGVPYFERDLLKLIRQGRGLPAVPLLLTGIAPWSSYGAR